MSYYDNPLIDHAVAVYFRYERKRAYNPIVWINPTAMPPSKRET